MLYMYVHIELRLRPMPIYIHTLPRAQDRHWSVVSHPDENVNGRVWPLTLHDHDSGACGVW